MGDLVIEAGAFKVGASSKDAQVRLAGGRALAPEGANSQQRGGERGCDRGGERRQGSWKREGDSMHVLNAWTVCRRCFGRSWIRTEFLPILLKLTKRLLLFSIVPP